MSSMKLFKPSYSYGANQKSFSEYEHQESRNQYNYANNTLGNKPNPSCYDSLPREPFVGRSVGDLGAYESSHARANKSINHYAHAQRALPSPSIHVQQGHHGIEKMKMEEGRMGHEWASNSHKCSNPALGGNHSSLTMDNKNHMIEEMEHGWTSKPKEYSSPRQPYHMGQSKYNEQELKAYDSDEDNIEGGYSSQATVLSSPKYLGPITTNQPGFVAKHKDQMMRKTDQGWANTNSKFSSPTQSQARCSGLEMDDEEHMMRKTNTGWDHSTNESGLAKGHTIGRNDRGWSHSPNNLSDATPYHNAGMELHDEDHVIGKVDNGWANVRSKFSGPVENHHSGLGIQKAAYMMGKMDHNGKSNSPSNFSSPTQANLVHGMQKEEDVMGNKSLGWGNPPAKYSGPDNFNGTNHTMHRERGQHGWGGKYNNGYGAGQLSHSTHTSYDGYDQCVDEGVHDIMDEILTKYPSHNVSGGHGSSWAAKPNAYASQNLVGGYAKQQAFGAANFGTAAQSMATSSSKFAMKKEFNAAHSSSFKKDEYSASSSAKKFEANSMINRGGYC